MEAAGLASENRTRSLRIHTLDLAEEHLHNKTLADACRTRLTQGHARLGPARPSKKLITGWRLWVPSTRKQTYDRQARNSRSGVFVFALAQYRREGLCPRLDTRRDQAGGLVDMA